MTTRVEERPDKIIAIIDEQDGVRREILLRESHRVYVHDMRSRFDYFFDAVAADVTQPDGVCVVDYSYPHDHLVVGFTDFPIRCPSLAEPFAACEQYLELAHLAQGDVVLDLGAYSGLSTIAFSKAVGANGRVIALGPDAENYKACLLNLERHAAASGLTNVFMTQAAITAKARMVSFSTEGSMGSADSRIVGIGRGPVQKVQGIPLAEIAHSLGLVRLDVIKMDIEGMEAEVLQSAGDFLRRFRPRIIVEAHYLKTGITTNAVIDALRAAGYQCETVRQPGIELPLVVGRPIATPVRNLFS